MVARSNLPRQILYSDDDVSSSALKAIRLIEQCSRLFVNFYFLLYVLCYFMLLTVGLLRRQDFRHTALR